MNAANPNAIRGEASTIHIDTLREYLGVDDTETPAADAAAFQT